MTTTQVAEPEFILYDLACIKNVCFSPVVWKIRLMLNYKRIPYKTIFLEFPDIEPTLKSFGIVPGEYASESEPKYTVPAVYHVPTKTYMMDSTPISRFIESTYPEPALPLTSDLGLQIESEARAAGANARTLSTLPREYKILSPRAADYFRGRAEPILGCRLEDAIDPEKEDESWDAISDKMQAVSALMQTHKKDGPFVLGAQPSYTDFFIAGALQCMRTIDEGIFQRVAKYDGYRSIYEACLPYMEKKD